jgi:uncharacterized small protein (DUF1192 family)
MMDYQDELAQLTNACLKLRGELDVDKNPGMIGSPVEVVLQAAADIAQLKDEIAKLNNKLPCGHRLVDWDDSYGGCAFCAIQQQAFAYDKLPHEVIECHDKIEELESKFAKLTAELERVKTVEFPHKVEAVAKANVVQGLEIALGIIRSEPCLIDAGVAVQAEISKVRDGKV